MRAAVYARFSSENQREQSIEDQVRVCKQFAIRDGIEVLDNHIYFDEARVRLAACAARLGGVEKGGRGQAIRRRPGR